GRSISRRGSESGIRHRPGAHFPGKTAGRRSHLGDRHTRDTGARTGDAQRRVHFESDRFPGAGRAAGGSDRTSSGGSSQRSMNRKRGFTLIELIVTVTIVGILAGLAVPLARNSIQREREYELRHDLREIRIEIDKYKEASDRDLIQMTLGTEGYPEKLDVLVEGGPMLNATSKKLKIVR